MTKDETGRFLIWVKSIYPNHFKDVDEYGTNLLVNSWFEAFQDIPANVMAQVFQKHLMTQEYAPTVKRLREAALEIMSPISVISGESAWAIAAKKVSNFGRYNKPEGMEYLRANYPIIAKAVDAIGYENICNAPNDGGYVKRGFVNYYNEIDAPEREQNLIPESMWKKIQQMSQENVKRLDKNNDLPEM